MSGSRSTLPNVITLVRILACPFIFWLAISTGVTARFWAFGLFVAAALSDVWDGYLARRYDLVTDIGKLLDPVADKLLLVATVVPIFLISQRGGALDPLPGWGPMPLWVLAVIFGRELFITIFRSYAVGRGVVIAAGRAGKLKALFQSLFVGGALLWYALVLLGVERGWEGPIWGFWQVVHSAWVWTTLWVAIILTVYSMLDYLWSYRTLVGIRD